MFVQNSPTWAKLALETLGPIWTLEPIWLFPFYSAVATSAKEKITEKIIVKDVYSNKINK